MLSTHPRSRTRALSALTGLIGVLLTAPLQSSPLKAEDAASAPHTPKRMLLSGHSLTDDPLGGYIAMIAESQGQPLTWNQQIVIGSPIRVRTRGLSYEPGVWDGYRQGKNRNGRQGADMLQELAADAERKYDTLIVAEGHHSVAQLMWNDTVRFLRHYHERLIEHNGAGRTYFFEPWESITDKSNPKPWIALETQAATTWACVTSRVNKSLALEGRSDRIAAIPAASALAALIDAAVAGRIPALAADTPEATINRLLQDAVHSTFTGHYYIALVSYMTIAQRPVDNAWHPRDIPPEIAKALQDFAWEFVDTRRRTFKAPDLATCRSHMAQTFCDTWNAYVPGKWTHKQEGCKYRFAAETVTPKETNPFAFDAAADGGYWHPAP